MLFNIIIGVLAYIAIGFFFLGLFIGDGKQPHKDYVLVLLMWPAIILIALGLLIRDVTHDS
jgi:EamA domain-containing membrane protein RarD